MGHARPAVQGPALGSRKPARSKHVILSFAYDLHAQYSCWPVSCGQAACGVGSTIGWLLELLVLAGLRP
jgi:hypothetical protein